MNLNIRIELGGLSVVLTVIFVVLKLVGKISWSWFWVFSPLWITLLLFLIIIAIMLLLFMK